MVGIYKFSITLTSKRVNSNSRGRLILIGVKISYYNPNPLNNLIRIF